ncbi:MAG: hypothetical protein MUF81_19650 [Verrucomicrobia bacterium]|nr:hypothetical protein [Verrucomicrobiota bacterium]
MNYRLLILAMPLALCLTAQAGLFYYSPTLNAVIPDANPNGVANTLTVSDWGSGWTVTDVNVTLTVNNGWNGDLYAYLSHDGILVPLLNRVGTGSGSEPQYTYGFSTSGFGTVTLDDASTSGNIHGIKNPENNGTYQPDSGIASLANFNNNSYANGSWTIFFADLSGGDQSTLVSWGLELDAVPEPVTMGLGIFAGIFLVASFGRSKRVRNLACGRWVAFMRWVDAV